MTAEINQKENDMQLLIDGYQVQIVFPPNSIVVQLSRQKSKLFIMN